MSDHHVRWSSFNGEHHYVDHIYYMIDARPFGLSVPGPYITTKKDTSVTFWAEQKKLCHTYDTFMMIIVTKPGIIIDAVGSYFYDKKS